jgi:hypothetical protein
MKKLLVLLLLYSHLFSFSIDESVLNIHATLLPKLALMDLKYQEKLKDGSLNIVIFYSKRNLISAKYLRRDILTSYPNGIKKSPIKVRLCPYPNFIIKKKKSPINSPTTLIKKNYLHYIF